MKRLVVLCALVALLLPGASYAQSVGPDWVSEPCVPGLTVAVRDLPQPKGEPAELYGVEAKRRDDRGIIVPEVQGEDSFDILSVLQEEAELKEARVFGTTIVNVEGLDYNVYPPDPTGIVGPSHVMQGVNGTNSTVRILNKTGGTISSFEMQTLATAAPCTNGYCDPIVLYDWMANRWLISEFDGGADDLCIYVSQTSDPTGAWYYYTWNPPGTMQDYPKYGIWNDAYYISANNGGYVFAIDRNKMLNGQAATLQSFTLGTLSGWGFQLSLPASHAGTTPPPAGEPGILLRQCDGAIHSQCSSDVMQMWELDIDWVTSANSTLTRIADVPMTAWDQTVCGTTAWDCMPQQGTTQKLDPIREPLHFPVQYRNWGTYETIVGCFAVDVNGADKAAVRWFELRRGTGAWYTYQEGTTPNDTYHRSVCSAAMDGAGNIAVGYTRTSGTSYPSSYYAGRCATDPLGTLPYFEYVCQAGTSYQSSNERWGDYAGMGVDPSDDATFWWFGMYSEGANNSATRICSFKFSECTSCLAPSGLTNNTAADLDNCGDTGVRITWTQNPTNWNDGGSGTRTFDVLRNGTAIASGLSYSTTQYTDTTGVNGTTYTYTVRYNNGCGSNATTTGATAADNVGTAPSGLTNNTAADLNTCTDTGVQVSWTQNPTSWGDNGYGTRTYVVLRNGTAIQSGIAYGTTSYIDTTGVNGTSYNYTVRYINGCTLNATTTGAAATDYVGAVPSGLTNNTAVDIDACADTGVQVNWTQNPTNWGDNGFGTRTFDVLRNGTAIQTGIAYATTTYIDTTGVNGTSYNYTVRYVNGCDLTATTSGAAATDNVSHTVNVTPDGTTEVCTGTNIVFTANVSPAGSYTYQWTQDGTDIGGQIGTTLTRNFATAQSHTYNCKVTAGSCVVQDSTNSIGSWIVCQPNIIYQSSGNFTEITGDGDANYEPGEKWSVDVTLTNTGNQNATNVTAELAGNGIQVCNNPGDYGAIAISGSAVFTVEFVIDADFETTNGCGTAIGFDVITKVCDQLTPAGANQTDVFSITVGEGSAGTSNYDYTYSGTTTITSKTTTNFAYNVPDSGTIVSVSTDVSMTPPLGGSPTLQVYLISPTATQVTIFDGDPNLWVNGTWSFTTQFDGQDLLGNWTLRVVHGSRGAPPANGTLTDWQLHMTVSGGGWDCSSVGSGTCSVCTPPSQPVITGITDNNACAQTGVTITYTAGSPATRHDLYVDTALQVSGFTSGSTYNPGNTTSHGYVIRAVNNDDTCFTDSASSAFADINNTPGAPTVTSVTDIDGCASTGVSVTFTAGSGATSHDLWVDGVSQATNISSPYTYVPGNAASHNYVVRALNGTCWTASNTVAGSDANNTPGAPTVTSVTDIDGCASTGVSVTFTAGSGATSHDLWVDGVSQATNISSPYTYVPGDAASHNYVVRALNGTCWTASNTVAGIDSNDSVTVTPVITGIVDNDQYAQDGIYITYTAGSPATRHDLYDNGSLAVTGYVSGALYNPGDTLSHDYVVRAINGPCFANSSIVAGTDEALTGDAPPEIMPIGWTDSSTINWNVEPTATSGYALYRGLMADLPMLADINSDFCTRATTSDENSNSVTIAETAPVGNCYYFLVVGVNAFGESTAGKDSNGVDRQLNTTGVCP